MYAWRKRANIGFVVVAVVLFGISSVEIFVYVYGHIYLWLMSSESFLEHPATEIVNVFTYGWIYGEVQGTMEHAIYTPRRPCWSGIQEVMGTHVPTVQFICLCGCFVSSARVCLSLQDENGT